MVRSGGGHGVDEEGESRRGGDAPSRQPANVYKVAVAYAGVGSLLIQVACNTRRKNRKKLSPPSQRQAPSPRSILTSGTVRNVS
jgi:hypothetical protein